MTTPPPWLGDASTPVWQSLALMSETKGEWAAAARAWEGTAQTVGEDYAAAGAYCSAAACAYVGDDDDLSAEILAHARERYPRHPRLVFEEVRRLPPERQLAELADVETRDPGDVALVSPQRSLAALVLPDVDAAERYAQRAARRCQEAPLPSRSR